VLANDRATLADSAAKWQLRLRNGDVLLGEPIAIAAQADGSLSFKTDELDVVEVPLKAVASLAARDAKSPEMAAAAKDSVRFRSGDIMEGLLVGLADGKISMQSDLGGGQNTDIKLENVERVALAGVAPARGVPPLGVRIGFVGGSVLTAANFTWNLGKITFTDPTGKERSCPADSLRYVQVLGGRIVWLSELDPSKEVQRSFLGTKWPMQVDRNVMGGPLVIARNRFQHGLGVHTRSVLSYDLDGSFSTLNLRCGLDDSAAPHGTADLSIVLDGKILWQAKGMKAGTLSEPLQLTITDGRKLELRAEPADTLDVQGRVDWVDVALVRP
jgi:hypothetical protein